MKKRILSLLLCLVLVAGLLPTVALATAVENCGDTACAHIAAIGTTHYDTLQDAIVAAMDENTTVTLLKDTTGYVTISKNLTLDLNGNTLNGVANTSGTETLALKAEAGNVTVKKGTIKGRVNAYDAATLTIDKDVTIENKPLGESSCYGIVVWGDGNYGEEGCKTPTLNLYGKVNLAGEDSIEGFAISTNGTDASKPIINIYDGAEIISNDIALYLPSGSLTVYGGTLTGATAVYFKSTNLDIRGGVFTGTGEKIEYTFYGNGAYATGDAVVIDNCNYPGGIDDVKISGGTFISNNANAVGSYAGNGKTEALTGFVIGGTFNSDVSAYVKDNHFQKTDGQVVPLNLETAIAAIGDTPYLSVRMESCNPQIETISALR